MQWKQYRTRSWMMVVLVNMHNSDVRRIRRLMVRSEGSLFFLKIVITGTLLNSEGTASARQTALQSLLVTSTNRSDGILRMPVGTISDLADFFSFSLNASHRICDNQSCLQCWIIERWPLSLCARLFEPTTWMWCSCPGTPWSVRRPVDHSGWGLFSTALCPSLGCLWETDSYFVISTVWSPNISSF